MVTFLRPCSVVQRLLQPASAPLELVPAVEDIGLVAVDSSGKAEVPDQSLQEAGCNQLEEADCSSPTEEHVLVASSSVCELRLFVVVAVGR